MYVCIRKNMEDMDHYPCFRHLLGVPADKGGILYIHTTYPPTNPFILPFTLPPPPSHLSISSIHSPTNLSFLLLAHLSLFTTHPFIDFSFLFFHSPIHSSIHFFYPCTCPSNLPFIHLPIQLSMSPSIYLPTHLSIILSQMHMKEKEG